MAHDVVRVGVAAVLVVRRHDVRAELADDPDQRLGGHLDRLEREAAVGQRRQRVALGQPGVDEAEPRVLARRGPPARLAISRRRTCAMSRRISGSCCSSGLRMSPRSPPVHETTSTSTPSATYFAIVAAPLLDSSSGCACTAISRSRSPTSTPAHVLEPVITDHGSSTMDLVPSSCHRACGRPDGRSPRAAPPPGSRHRQVVGRRCRRVPLGIGPGHLVRAGQHARPGHVDRPRLRARRRPSRGYLRRPPPDRPRRPCVGAPSTSTDGTVGAVTVTIPAGGEASVHRVTLARPPRRP